MRESDVALIMRENHQKINQMLSLKVFEYDITFGMLFLTMKIDMNPEASQKELAEQMKFTQGAMSSVVKRLIKHNIVEQITLESDTRYKRLIVTDFGKSIINDYQDYVVKNYEQMFDGLDVDELKKLFFVLTKVNDNLDKIISKRSMEINLGKEG